MPILLSYEEEQRRDRVNIRRVFGEPRLQQQQEAVLPTSTHVRVRDCDAGLSTGQLPGSSQGRPQARTRTRPASHYGRRVEWITNTPASLHFITAGWQRTAQTTQCYANSTGAFTRRSTGPRHGCRGWQRPAGQTRGRSPPWPTRASPSRGRCCGRHRQRWLEHTHKSPRMVPGAEARGLVAPSLSLIHI